MNFRADMVGNETHDTFAVGRRQPLFGIGQTSGKPVHPEPSIRVQHYLDDGGFIEKPRDRRPERGAQHTCATCDRFRFFVCGGHFGPVSLRGASDDPRIGVD